MSCHRGWPNEAAVRQPRATGGGDGLVESNSSDMAAVQLFLGRNTLGRQEEMGWWTNFFS